MIKFSSIFWLGHDLLALAQKYIMSHDTVYFLLVFGVNPKMNYLSLQVLAFGSVSFHKIGLNALISNGAKRFYAVPGDN
jgi:hypothetical protein